MKTSVERVDETTVKLRVEVEPERVRGALDEAAARLASEVRVPGFRPGKAPRRVLETRLGKEAIVSEAVRGALPTLYSEAARAEELAAVGSPEFDVERFEEADGAEFTATVEVLPEVTLPELTGIQVAHPEWEVTDEEVDEQLEGLRDRHAQLEAVERAADVGDHVLVTVTAERGGEPVAEAGAEDVLYEIHDAEQTGSELDRVLVGAEAGAILKFSDTLGPDYGELSGQQLDFTAIVKDVKTKRLPDLDDEFAITASEFDTIAQLREDLRGQIAREKLRYAQSELRGKVVQTVCEAVEVPLPNALVEQELGYRVNRMAAEAQRYGVSFEQYLEAVGVPAEELRDRLEPDAQATVKAQIVVDAYGREAGVEIEQSDLSDEIMRQAARLGQPPQELANLLTQPDHVGALISDAFRRRAIDRLIEEVQILSAPPEDVVEELLAPPATGEETPEEADETE